MVYLISTAKRNEDSMQRILAVGMEVIRGTTSYPRIGTVHRA